MEVSVILPTYNELGNIIPLVKEIHNNLKGFKHEIIIVDDNSPDGTYKALFELNKPYLKPILRLENAGFANSIRCGLENSSGEIIIIMDSDFNHQPKYLPFMIKSIDSFDCVSASRFVYGGAMNSRVRHLLSWLFNIFTRIMTGGKVTDSLYGFVAVKRNVMLVLDFDKIFWGYGDYCIRLMFYLQKKNNSILQFPAINGKRRDGTGNSNFFKVFKQYFIEVVKLTFRERI